MMAAEQPPLWNAPGDEQAILPGHHHLWAVREEQGLLGAS